MIFSLLGEADETDSEKGVRRTIILSHIESVRMLDYKNLRPCSGPFGEFAMQGKLIIYGLINALS